MDLELGLKITRNSNDHLTLDSTETENSFVLLIHLPGLKKDETEISINQEGTEIRVNGGGGRSILEDVICGRLRIHKEVEATRFRKVFRIPYGVILNQIEARCDEEKGNLFVIMPKSIKECSPEMRIEEVNQEGHEEKEAIDPDDRGKSQEWEAPDEGFLNEANTSDPYQELLESVELHSPGALDPQEPETIQNGELKMKETGVSEEKEQETEVTGSEDFLGSRSSDVQEPQEIIYGEDKTNEMGMLEEKEQERETLETREIRMREEKDRETEPLGLEELVRPGTSDVKQPEEIRNGELKTDEKGNTENEMDPPGKGQIQMLEEKEKETQSLELRQLVSSGTSDVQQPEVIQNEELKTDEKGNEEQEIDPPVKGQIQMLEDKEKETQASGLGQLLRSGTSAVQQPELIQNEELKTDEKGNKEQEIDPPWKGSIQMLEDKEKETQALGLGQLLSSGTSDVQQPEEIQIGELKTDEKGNKEQETDPPGKGPKQMLESKEKETQALVLGQLLSSGTLDVQQPEEIQNGELKPDEKGNYEKEINPPGKGQIQMLEDKEKEIEVLGLGQLLRSGTSDVQHPEDIQNEQLKTDEKGIEEQEIDPPGKGEIQMLEEKEKEAEEALGLGHLLGSRTSDVQQPKEIRTGDLKLGEIGTPVQIKRETAPLLTEEMETTEDVEQGTQTLGLDEVNMKEMETPEDVEQETKTLGLDEVKKEMGMPEEEEKETETLGVEKPKMEGMGMEEEKGEKEHRGSEELNSSGPSSGLQSIQEIKNGELDAKMRGPDGGNQELEEIFRSRASHLEENKEIRSEELKMIEAGLSEEKEQAEGAEEGESKEAKSPEPEQLHHGDPATEVLDRASDALEPDAKLDQNETSHAELDQHNTSDPDRERTQRDLEEPWNSLAEMEDSAQKVLKQVNLTSKEGEASSNEKPDELGFKAKERSQRSGREWGRRRGSRRRGRATFSSFPPHPCMMAGSAFLFSLVVLVNHFSRANGR